MVNHDIKARFLAKGDHIVALPAGVTSGRTAEFKLIDVRKDATGVALILEDVATGERSVKTYRPDNIVWLVV